MSEGPHNPGGDPGPHGPPPQGHRGQYPPQPYSPEQYWNQSYPSHPYGSQGARPSMPGPPTHSLATTSLVLGIIGLASVVLACGIGLIASPFAWGLGRKAVREIDESHGALGGRDNARAGQVMGIIGTVLLGLILLIAVAVVVLVVWGVSVSDTTTTTYSEF